MKYNVPQGKVRKFTAGELEVSPDNSKTIHGLKVDANGNVGIGTRVPSKKLDISGDVKLSGKLEGITNLALNTSVASMSSQEVLRIKGTGNNFNTLVVMGQDDTTKYVSLGINSNGWPTVAGGYVGSSGASNLAFATQAGGGSAETIKMVIHPEGQLSLGATNIGDGEKVRIIGTGDNFNTFVLFGQDSSTEYVGMGVKSGVPTITGGYAGTGDAALAFQTSANTETERMRIDKDGNVGIGTTAPKVPLDIYEMGGLIVAMKHNHTSTTTTNVAFTTSMASLGSGVANVTFKCPANGKILFESQFFLVHAGSPGATGQQAYYAIHDGSGYVYDIDNIQLDSQEFWQSEGSNYMVTVSAVIGKDSTNTNLVPGNTYTFQLYVKSTASSKHYVYYGSNYPPIITKALTVPDTQL